MNERAVDKVNVTIPIDIRDALRIRRKFYKDGDTRTDYYIRALKAVVKDVKLTVADEQEAVKYIREQAQKREQKRNKENTK